MNFKKSNFCGESKGPLGRKPVLSLEDEQILVAHEKMENLLFAPDWNNVKEIRFQLTQKLSIVYKLKP